MVHAPHAKSARRSAMNESPIADLANEHDLDTIAQNSRFPYRPSDLFLKMFGAAQETLVQEPLSGVVSPPLLGSSGVVPFTIISVVTDIMKHYHDVILAADKEILLATNAWEPGKSVQLVTSAFEELDRRMAKEN